MLIDILNSLYASKKYIATLLVTLSSVFAVYLLASVLSSSILLYIMLIPFIYFIAESLYWEWFTLCASKK